MGVVRREGECGPEDFVSLLTGSTPSSGMGGRMGGIGTVSIIIEEREPRGIGGSSGQD